MKIEAPQNVKYFIGALYSDVELMEQARKICADKMGDLDFLSEPFPFDVTEYYDEEMGTPIYRIFFSFLGLGNPGDLAQLKLECNFIEEELELDGKRKVNLDIGYLDFHKVVLASAKYNGQKVYLDQGIYADVTLLFEAGGFQALKNTFPDFKTGRYDPVLMEMRNKYKHQLKS